MTFYTEVYGQINPLGKNFTISELFHPRKSFKMPYSKISLISALNEDGGA